MTPQRISLAGSLLAAGAAALALLAAGEARAEGAPRTLLVPLRDGRSLPADLWAAPGGEPRPAILVQTPLDRKRFRPPFAAEAYHWVAMDARGFHGGREAYVPMPDPGKDGYDAVEWLARQPWCGGKVAVWGPSALGRAALRTAAERPPHLACGVPLAAPLAFTHGQFFPGGVWRMEMAQTLDSLGEGAFVLLAKAHPAPDLFWKVAESRPRAGDIEVPLLLVSGWFDLHPDGVLGTFHALRRFGGAAARDAHRLLLGPWTHAAPGRPEQGELVFEEAAGVPEREARRFLDRYLLGIPNGWEKTAPVRAFRMGADEWVELASWPPPGVAERALFLGPATLGRSVPFEGGSAPFPFDPRTPVPTVGGSNFSAFVPSGPRDQRERVEGRPDVLAFSTPPLEAPLTLCGRLRAELFVECGAPSCDVHVRLCDVHPDGRSMLVADGARRAALPPGEPARVEVGLPSTFLTFLPGHRVRVLVAASNYPRFERAGKSPVEPRLLWGTGAASCVRLPVLEAPDPPGGD